MKQKRIIKFNLSVIDQRLSLFDQIFPNFEEYSTMNFFATSFALLAITSLGILTAEACTCASTSISPPNSGCKGEFMAIVTITNVVPDQQNWENKFSFKIIADQTPALADKKSLKKYKYIRSGLDSAACGIDLEVGATYLLKGSMSLNKPSVWACSSYVQKLGKVPTRYESKRMLNRLYAKQCK